MQLSLKHDALVYSLFSILIPLAVYSSVFVVTGSLFEPPIEARKFAPLLASNAIGFILAVIALLKSGPKPVNMSRDILITVLLASLGMLANVIAVEFILSAHIFPHNN